MKNRKSIYLIIFCFCLSFASLAQESDPHEVYFDSKLESKQFDESEWKSVVKGIDYSGEKVEEVDVDDDEEGDGIADGGSTDKFKNKKSSQSSSDTEFWASVFKFLFIAIAVLVIAYLAYRLIGEGIGRPRSRSFTPDKYIASLEEIEENIHEHDFRHHIRQAVSEKKFALAIRLYYLAILKELSLNKRIKWKRDKTNREYLREMSSSTIYVPFHEATGIFERVWYGRGKVEEADFIQIEVGFEQLIGQAQLLREPKD